ncbi:MAG: LysE/ArgO family amino acid transporter [Microbacterium sp.]
MSSILSGFGLGLSLIVAIGAQNLFLLRQGIRREHAGAVALVCALSDAALIAIGVSGLGAALQATPGLIDVARWAGAAFLAVYAALAARRALRPSGDTLRLEDDVAENAQTVASSSRSAPIERSRTAASAIATCLGLTWLNPHVYLDTVFLLGSVASTHGDARWWFAAGAAAASFLWFFGLALGARRLGRVLSTPRAWRVLDGVIALVMIAIAVGLVWPR